MYISYFSASLISKQTIFMDLVEQLVIAGLSLSKLLDSFYVLSTYVALAFFIQFVIAQPNTAPPTFTLNIKGFVPNVNKTQYKCLIPTSWWVFGWPR